MIIAQIILRLESTLEYVQAILCCLYLITHLEDELWLTFV